MKRQTGLSEHEDFREQYVYKYIACHVWIFENHKLNRLAGLDVIKQR